jgi:integrase
MTQSLRILTAIADHRQMQRGQFMSKRGTNGRGTVFKDKDGRWWAQLPKGEDGKRPKASAATEAEAVEALKALEAKRRQGIRIGDSRQTLETFLRLWLDEVIIVESEASTAEDYENIVRLHILPHLGTVRLCDLTALDIQRWLNMLRKQKIAWTQSKRVRETARPVRTLAGPTRENIWRRLHTALEYAKDMHLVSENVAALALKRKKGKKRATYFADTQPREHHPLTAGQARQLLAALDNDRLYALYLLTLSLGLRLGEALGLRWVDLNWERGELKITQIVRTVGNRTVFGKPKTQKSRRTLPLTPMLLAALQVHQQQQRRETLSGPWTDFGLIFPSEVGTPIGPRNMQRAFKRLLKRAQLPAIRFHDLRHTAASLMLSEGTPITDVSEILGHSSVAITARVYAHAYEQGKRAAVDTMSRLFIKVSV